MSRTLFLLALLLVVPAQAQHGDDAEFDSPRAEARRITPGADITSGAMRVTQGDATWELPLLHTTVDTWITGLVAEAEVTQTYENPFDEPIEAVYLFPLPDDSAVREMVMSIGDRRIVGKIKRREEARQLYERARDNGQAAALLDQERPNVFTQRVANILPGESIEITISFAQVLRYEDGAYEWVMPLVVGPRYVPPEGTGVRSDGPSGAAINPVMSEAPTGSTVDIRVDLDAGMPIYDVQSPSHAIRVIEDGPHSAFVELDRDGVPNKDFILRYALSGDAPETAAMSHWGEQGGHFLLMIQPPADDQLDGMITPKDLVFLIDTSCSQSGAPMAAAKRAMSHAIDGLNPHDRYTIMNFSSTVGPAISGGASRADRQRAKDFVGAFRGAGGTNMLAGVEAALSMKERDALRTVLMITDGYVGNEPRILGAIEENLGRSRFFTLGTGSSVNRYLIDRAAQVGRGDVQVIRPDEDAGPAVERFYDRIRNPLLTDIDISWKGVELVDVHPDPIKDLFSGQPVILVGRYEQPGRGEITIEGLLGNRPWSKTVEVDFTGEGGNPALDSLWARRWIEDLSLRQHFGRAFDDRHRFEEEVTDLALGYSLMSEYTSFVAVEERVINEGGEQRTVDVPTETPEFVEFEAVADGEDLALPVSSALKRSRRIMRAPTRSAPARPAPAAAPVYASPPSGGAATGVLDKKIAESTGLMAQLGPLGDVSASSTPMKESVSNAHGGLIGSQYGNQYGSGGLGSSGTSVGGGGTAAGLGGSGTVGTAQGSSGYGRGGGYYGAQGGEGVAVKASEPIVLGSIDKSVIDRVIKQHLAQIRYCYEKELTRDPSLAGRVVLKFVIGKDGAVTSVEIKETTLADETLEACLSARFLRMRFPAPAGGGIVVVSYPLVFSPSE